MQTCGVRHSTRLFTEFLTASSKAVLGFIRFPKFAMKAFVSLLVLNFILQCVQGDWFP